MRRIESEAERMSLLVEDLLLLARLDQQRPLQSKPVDLLAIAGDAVQDARILAPGRAISLAVEGRRRRSCPVTRCGCGRSSGT